MKIPYLASHDVIPERANATAYEAREILGMIFFWFDAEGRKPVWEIRHHEDIDENYYHALDKEMEFDQHILEMSMNSADEYHFNNLHAGLPLPFLEKYSTLKHKVDTHYGTGKADSHVSYFDEVIYHYEMFGMEAPASIYKNVKIQVIFEGPSIIHFSLITPFGKARMIKTQLPTEPMHVHVGVKWFAEKNMPFYAVKLLATIAANALEQDRPVWENKIYLPKPTLVKNDGFFNQFHKWYCTEFYSDSSVKVGSDNENFEW